MYDLPEAREHTDRLWQHLAAAMREAGVKDVPDRLNREQHYESLWRRSDLLFSQTCGYPLVHEFRDRLRPVVTPIYGAPGCRGPHYSSVVLVHDDAPHRQIAALRGSRCAVNSPMSQSGYNALRVLVAPMAQEGRFFSDVKVTGSHVASITALRKRRVDVCAVDCVTYALLGRYRPEALTGTRMLCRTPSCPGLPFVTRADLDPDQFRRLRGAVLEAFTDPDTADTRGALLIEGVDELDMDAYQVVLGMESMAASAGYLELR